MTKAARDARLDELEKASKDYGEKKLEQLDYEAQFLESVINSRTGAGQLADQGIFGSVDLLADSIKQFLEG